MGTAAAQRCGRCCDNTSVLESLLTITSREGVWILQTARAPLRPLRLCVRQFALRLLFVCSSFALRLLFVCSSFALRLLFV